MALEDNFHRLASEVCGDICGTERHLEFNHRTKRNGRNIGTGHYTHSTLTVNVTFGESVHDNIATMLHELSHHVVALKYPWAQSHGQTFWQTYFTLLQKYEEDVPGLIAAEMSYHGIRNGIWLHVAMDMNFPGAREVWNQLVDDNNRRNEKIRQINTRIATRQTDQAFEFIMKKRGS